MSETLNKLGIDQEQLIVLGVLVGTDYNIGGVPGIGPKKAGRLLDRFGSVEAAVTASSTELQSVEGVGKSIAERIRRVVS